MSWHEVGEALGVAELAQARGSSLGRGGMGVRGAAAGPPGGQPGEFRWTCQDAARP